MKTKILLKLLLWMIGVTFFVNCDRQVSYSYEEQLLNEFIKSDDFQMNDFLNSKKVDYEKSGMHFLNNDPQKPIIIIFFSSNNQIIGSVEAIKNTSEGIILPNNDKYFMLYRNLNHFDFECLTGFIELYDLNYEKYLVCYGEINEGNLEEAITLSMPKPIITKYQDIIHSNAQYLESRKLVTKMISPKAAANPCDANNNGNISFGECYSCFIDACGSDATCKTLCFLIGDVVGWVLSPINAPWCQTSIAASCVYISIAY